MESYSLSVCLTDLQGAQVVANQQGQQFVQIPIQMADLFLTEKGKVYLNLNMWANKSGQPDQYGKTHSVKQNLPKEKQDAIKASGAKTPFIGSGKPIQMKNQQPQAQNQAVYQQTAPQGYQAYQPAPANNMYPQGAQPYTPHQSTDDIPF